MDTSDRRYRKELEPLDEARISPRKERRERKVKDSDFANEYIVSPRKERHERRRESDQWEHHQVASPRREHRRRSNDDNVVVETSDEFLRNRRDRQERKREEALEVETLERKEQREHRERRSKDEGSSRRKHRPHHTSSVGGSHSHRQHTSSSHRHHHIDRHLQTETDPPFPGEVYLERTTPIEGIPVDHDKQVSSGPAELWSPPTRRGMEIPTTINVPIDVIVEHPPEQPKVPKRERKSPRTKTDYDRLRQLLHEQSEKSDSDTDSDPDHAMVLDKLHPLISASDEEFQEAFDNLAKDSVFDDNFEKAFNEFSEHYLALSPWGEDDSTGMKDQCDRAAEQDFIQIPLTPVSKKGITSYISKDNKKLYRGDENESDDVVRTPVLERGFLTASDLDNKHVDHKKPTLPTAEEMVEVSRTPYFRQATSSPMPSNEESPEDDDKVTELVNQTSDHSSSRARSEPSPRRGSMRKLFRGKRQASKATV